MGLEGSCLCRAIRYEVDRLDPPIGHCHCATCRKAHAAAFTTTAGVLRAHFRWVEEADKLTAYESSLGKLRYFCSICGTHLLAERPSQAHVILRVATLDEDTGERPAMHIWTSHDVAWLTDGDAVPYHDAWPPGR